MFLDYDDVRCTLNPTTSGDLERILLMVLPARRINVAVAVTGLTREEWYDLAGISDNVKTWKSMQTMWLTGERRMPLGVAARLAKVLGVRSEVLFESLLNQERYRR